MCIALNDMVTIHFKFLKENWVECIQGCYGVYLKLKEYAWVDLLDIIKQLINNNSLAGTDESMSSSIKALKEHFRDNPYFKVEYIENLNSYFIIPTLNIFFKSFNFPITEMQLKPIYLFRPPK